MVHIWGLSKDQIEECLRRVNTVFNGNIVFKRCDLEGQKYVVTLTVISSRADGARVGHTGRRISAACWHVYGMFFAECFYMSANCRIKQCGQLLTKENNWRDKNIGSIVEPLLYSNACMCKGDYELMIRLNQRRYMINDQNIRR